MTDNDGLLRIMTGYSVCVCGGGDLLGRYWILDIGSLTFFPGDLFCYLRATPRQDFIFYADRLVSIRIRRAVRHHRVLTTVIGQAIITNIIC